MLGTLHDLKNAMSKKNKRMLGTLIVLGDTITGTELGISL